MIDIKSILAQQPQRQDSLMDQLQDLRMVANRCGMYDAADYLRTLIEDNLTPKCKLPHAPYTPNDCKGFMTDGDGNLIPLDKSARDPQWMREAIAYLFDDYKISAIQVIRNASGLSLKDSLLIATHLEKDYKLGVYDPAKHSFLAEKPLDTLTPLQNEVYHKFTALIEAEYSELLDRLDK